MAGAGTHIRVYGRQTGNGFTLSQGLDGVAAPLKNMTPPSIGSYKGPHFLLVEFSDLVSGNHTLRIVLEEIRSGSLSIDYILYKPSFPNLASMPDLRNVSGGWTRSGQQSVILILTLQSLLWQPLAS